MSLAMIRGAKPTERAAILAGLRLLQATLVAQQLLDPDIEEIFTNGGQLVPLKASPFGNRDEFDALCEQLNTA